MEAARLHSRLWSSLIDAFVVVAWLLFVALLRPWPESAPGLLRALAWYVPALLVEPVSIWRAGRTLGQRAMGLRVVSLSLTPPTLPTLIGRHLLKAAFLGFSLFYVPFSGRGQALHDRPFKTLVVPEDTAAVAVLEAAAKDDRLQLRRFLVTLAWAHIGSLAWGLGFVVAFLALIAFVDPGRIEDGNLEPFIEIPLAVIVGAKFMSILARGARGLLPGTRP